MYLVGHTAPLHGDPECLVDMLFSMLSHSSPGTIGPLQRQEIGLVMLRQYTRQKSRYLYAIDWGA
jgi:hypothetical protein